MRDNFTNKHVTMAKLRKSIYPSPIWSGQLINGQRFRLSFNCPDGITNDEMMARARFQAADFLRWHGSPVPTGQVQRETPYPRNMRMIRLFVEDRRRPGRKLTAAVDLDPWQDYSAVTHKRARVTVKQLKAALADVLKLVNGAAHEPAAKATLEQAEQLLAA
jgi:hypothetical protein